LLQPALGPPQRGHIAELADLAWQE